MVRLREKDLPASRLLALANRLRQLTDGKALLFVNDRVDVALAAGADGVQLGEEGLPVDAARRVSGSSLLLGRSVHSVDGGVAAASEGADFLIAGTIFATDSHPGGATQGLRLLKDLTRRVPIPVMAIGGVNEDNVESVMSAGAAGAAVVSAITESAEPAAAARVLMRRMGEAGSRTSGPAPVSSRC